EEASVYSDDLFRGNVRRKFPRCQTILRILKDYEA
ncbi:unnamed protein product, partial [Brassica rapa subsp. narinosa]